MDVDSEANDTTLDAALNADCTELPGDKWEMIEADGTTLEDTIEIDDSPATVLNEDGAGDTE